MTTTAAPQFPFTYALEADGTVQLHVIGQLGIHNHRAFKQQGEDLINTGHTRLVCDLTGCGYIDASGLGALVSLSRLAREQGGSLVLAAVNEDVKVLFELTRLDTVLDIRDAQVITADAGEGA